jgi:mannose-6-phosphate isomerase-like protein (cupin superfamily)
MGKIIAFTRFCLLLIFLALASTSQAQFHFDLERYPEPSTYENIHVQPLQSDSLSSAFIIWLKEFVQLHKHEHHTEVIYVLEGSGMMQIGNQFQRIKPGDMVFIPAGTPHSAKAVSPEPLKVLSIQSPYFDGTDRVFIDP